MDRSTTAILNVSPGDQRMLGGIENHGKEGTQHSRKANFEMDKRRDGSVKVLEASRLPS